MIEGENLCSGERVSSEKRGVVAEDITVHQLPSHLPSLGMAVFGWVVVRKGDDS
jgi:hypothetical protein